MKCNGDIIKIYWQRPELKPQVCMHNQIISWSLFGQKAIQKNAQETKPIAEDNK